MSNNQAVINRINQIINEISEENMGGRSKRYMGGKINKKEMVVPCPHCAQGDYNMWDPNTNMNYQYSVPKGGLGVPNIPIGGMGSPNLPIGGMGSVNLPIGGMGSVNLPIGGAEIKKKRKKRNDIGKPRKNEWTAFVKHVAKVYDIPYNQALKQASELKRQGYSKEDL